MNFRFLGVLVIVKNYEANDLKSTLIYIKDNYGLGVFLKQGRLIALLSDLAPSLKKEKSMLGRMDKAGMFAELISSQNMNEDQKKHNIALVLKKLVENDFIQPKIAREYVQLLVDILGLNIDVSGTTSAEKSERTELLETVTSDIVTQKKENSIISPTYSPAPNVVMQPKIIPVRKQSKFTQVFWGVALCLLLLFLFTLGKNSDYRKTLERAEQGDTIAQTDLGDMYYNGKGVTQNYSEAIKWYRKAADQGYMVAQDKLGDMYRDGIGVAVDYEEAWKWYRQSVAQGYRGAQASYGVMYKNGYGVEKNYAKAIEWYSKAGEQGDFSAVNTVGNLYWEGGYGIEQSYAKAVEYYRKAAEHGDRWAQNNLGNAYRNGNGVKRNYQEAVKWYRKAAEQGLAEAQNRLGVMYHDGNGVKQDYREAMKWFNKAAEQGYNWAQNNLGNAYRNGWGVKQDYFEAVKWYRKAAEQGLAESQNYLGVMYHNGNGVKQDYREAMKWFNKAAEQGYNWAQNNLGNVYRNGWGVKQDYLEAVKWYRKAADQGLAASQHWLGFMYENALGIDRDIKVAIEFYQKAASQGNEESEKTLERLQVGKFKVLNDEQYFNVDNNRINLEFIGAFRGGNPEGTRQYARQPTTGVLFYFVATSRRKNIEIRIDQSDLFDKKGKKFDTRGWTSIIDQSMTKRKRLVINKPVLIGFGFHMPASESEELPTIDSVRFQFNGQWYEIRNVKVRTWTEWEAIRDKRRLK